MIPAKAMALIAGEKREWQTSVASVDEAWKGAEDVFKKDKDARELTLTQFGTGGFIIRVLSKENLLYKIESVKEKAPAATNS